MNRRRVFSWIATLPFMGVITSASMAKPATKMHPRFPEFLNDELMPGLRSFETSEIELDIHCNYAYDTLFVKGYNLKTHRLNNFVITREQIISGDYKTRFAPQLHILISTLT